MYHDLIHCYNNTCFHTWIIEYTVQRKPLGCDRKHANLWLKCKLLLALNKTCIIGCHGAKQFLRKFSNLLSVKNLISHECRKKVINEIKTLEQRWDTYQRITVFESTHNWSSPGELWSAHSSSKKCPVSHGDGWCLTYRALQQRP